MAYHDGMAPHLFDHDDLTESAMHSRREELVLALLKSAAVARRPATKIVESHGLSLAQYNVLRILRSAGKDGMPTLAIRERMVEEAAGITRLINKLERASLVRRDRSTSDRRCVLCYITDRGLHLLTQLDDPIVEANEGAMQILSDADVDQLQRLLDLIHSRRKRAVGETRKVG
ncbi:MAG: MarR family transcriptional regulator [Gemmatimonadaceae bacterium]